MRFDDTVEARAIDLQWRQFAATRVVPLWAYDDTRTKVSVIHPADMLALVVKLSTYIMEKPVSRVEIAYPADWLEAIKERFAPAYILKRWPVRYTTRVVECSDIFPDSQLVVPKIGPSHRFVLVDGSRMCE